MMSLWPLLAAPFVGSFLGVLIRRLPAGRPVALARSQCEQCETPIQAVDLLPLISFVALRGRCRRCGGRIAAFHWQVELAATAVAAVALAAGGEGAVLWLHCAVGWTLLALAWIDGETMLLPDPLTLPLVPAGLLAAYWFEPWELADRALGAVLGYAGLRAVALAYRWWRGREGLGQGDAKLLAAVGAWVGAAALPTVLLGAALTGLGWAGLLRLRGAALTAASALPFGPFIALAGWVVLLLR